MHDSALGLHQNCPTSQDILGFTSGEQINLFSSRLAPKLSNKLDILGGASAEFEQIQLCTRLAPKFGTFVCLVSQDILDRRVGGACLALQDILGGTSGEQINLFSSRLAPKLDGLEGDAPMEFYKE